MWNTTFSGIAGLPDARPSERQLLSVLREALQMRLPATWRMEMESEVARNGKRIDALLTITSSDGASGRIVVEVKRTLDPKDIPGLVAQLRAYALPDEQMLVIAPYLGTRTRQVLAETAVNYADATGNLRIVLGIPALYIETSGADTNPWKERQPGLRSVKGPTAGRVVRALCDFRPPFGVAELAQRSNTPASSVSRVVALLDREALLARDALGTIIDVKWSALIGRWAQDYSFMTSNRVRTFLEPRGLDSLIQKLRVAPLHYAVTGSLAAARAAPIAPPRLAILYVRSADLAADVLALRPVERGANVLLAEPFDEVAFDRTSKQDDVIYAALSQVAADLLTGPGRGPEEGQGLLRWMEEHEDGWRQ